MPYIRCIVYDISNMGDISNWPSQELKSPDLSIKPRPKVWHSAPAPAPVAPMTLAPEEVIEAGPAGPEENLQIQNSDFHVGKLTVGPWKSALFRGNSSEPTLMIGRVELLIYKRVMWVKQCHNIYIKCHLHHPPVVTFFFVAWYVETNHSQENGWWWGMPLCDDPIINWNTEKIFVWPLGDRNGDV